MDKKTDYHGPFGNKGVTWNELFQIWLALGERIDGLYDRASIETSDDLVNGGPQTLNIWDADCFQTSCELWVDIGNILAAKTRELRVINEVDYVPR